MPALTHGRVVNGFNLLPRDIRFSNKRNATCCDKKLCCGRPLQYNRMQVGNIYKYKRVNSTPSNGKFAKNIAIGRSFAAKRAISRRVSNTLVLKDNNGKNIMQTNNFNLQRTFACYVMKPGRNFGFDDDTKVCCNDKGSIVLNSDYEITGFSKGHSAEGGGRICCKAMTASCLACAAGITPNEYCKKYPKTQGCKPEPDKPAPLELSKNRVELVIRELE
jgi:hypothetical protein